MGAAVIPPQAANVYSLDVECVANGTGHNARTVAQIALVDRWEQVVLNLYIKPATAIVSCLTPLTGLTLELLDQRGISLEEGLQTLRQYLPSDAVLVGQGINQDVQWLSLHEGRDYKSMVDLAGLFRVWNPRFKSYSVWSQDYLCQRLLGWDVAGQAHDAAYDAVKSMRLYHLWYLLQQDQAAWQQAQETLLSGTPEPSFAKANPIYEGVCQGNRKTCKCGDPFFT